MMEATDTAELSAGLARFLDRLSVEEREGLAGFLQDRRTFLAEDMTDVLAILRQLDTR
jgi:hypothetical protein